MVSKLPALVISSLLILGVSLAFSGCLDDPVPEMGMQVLEEEFHEGDAEENTAEEGYQFSWSKVEMENKDEALDLELDEDNFILETVDRELLEEKEEEAGEYEYPDIPDEEINSHEGGQGKDMPGSIGPEESAEFWIIFEIPEEDDNYNLIYMA